MMVASLLGLLIQSGELEGAERDLTQRWGRLVAALERLNAGLADALAEMKSADGSVPDARREFWAFRVRKDLFPCRIDIAQRAAGLPSIEDLWKKREPPFPAEVPPPSKLAPHEDVVKAIRDGYAAAKAKHAALLAKDRAAAVRWTERQIRELYQPLVQLNARGLAAVKGYTKLNADDGDQARWKVWAEREFLPRNAETEEVLRSNFGLLEDGPTDAVRAFILHQYSWQARHAEWKDRGGDYEWGSRTNWPVAFSMECEAAYQKLLDRRARLVLGED